MRTKIQDILDNIAKDYKLPTEPDKLIVYPWYLFGMGVSCHLSLQFRYLKERVYENLTKLEICGLKLGFNWSTTQALLWKLQYNHADRRLCKFNYTTSNGKH